MVCGRRTDRVFFPARSAGLDAPLIPAGFLPDISISNVLVKASIMQACDRHQTTRTNPSHAHSHTHTAHARRRHLGFA